MTERAYREPSVWERGALERVATSAQAFAPEYVIQVANCLVREYDDDHDLEIHVPEGPPVDAHAAHKGTYYITEMIYLDEDGEIVSLMLHGSFGKLKFLERYKGAGDILNFTPVPSQLKEVYGVPPDKWAALFIKP